MVLVSASDKSYGWAKRVTLWQSAACEGERSWSLALQQTLISLWSLKTPLKAHRDEDNWDSDQFGSEHSVTRRACLLDDTGDCAGIPGRRTHKNSRSSWHYSWLVLLFAPKRRSKFYKRCNRLLNQLIQGVWPACVQWLEQLALQSASHCWVHHRASLRFSEYCTRDAVVLAAHKCQHTNKDSKTTGVIR